MGKSYLTGIIEENRKRGRLSKIPFLPAAFPGPEEFWEILIQLVDHGADIIEIGVPFSDPVADGPVVAAASQEGLAGGGDLDYIFQGLESHRKSLDCGIVLMGYVNPFVQYGWAGAEAARPGATVQELMAASLEIMAGRARAAGVHGLVVPDLPLEETGPWAESLRNNGLDLIALVGPNTGLERMKRYSATAGGYIYVVSVLGITGVREGLPEEVSATLARAREAFELPLALGFGLTSPEQLAGLEASLKPEAAIFGSALIRHLKGRGSVGDFMAPWN
jgi:tryptophan synthase alpha chain